MFDSSFMEAVNVWMLNEGFKIVISIILAFIISHASAHVVEKLVRRLVKKTPTDTGNEVKRENTLIKIFTKTIHIVVWIVAGLMILAELGFEIGPLLAAVGIAGVAFGFGGQYLIRDLISGTFIIVENQYRVGDVACFDGTCGLVEDISMRMTTMRDLDGVVHHVPHGEIKKVSNLTKGFSRVNMNIGVSYDSDLEKVIRVVNTVGQELANDPEWKEHILEAPKFLRVDDFADSAVVVKILGDTIPLKQWDVAGELRMRLKIAFDREGIVIPFPQRDVHMHPVTQ